MTIFVWFFWRLQTLSAMRRHLTCRSVQRFGCRVILFIALDSTSRQRAIAQMVSLIVHHATFKCLVFSCALVHELAITVCVCVCARAQGGIQTVMLAMTAHPESESCQTYACSCLNLLVRDPGVQHLVDHEAGISCTLRMLQTWAQSEQVWYLICDEF